VKERCITIAAAAAPAPAGILDCPAASQAILSTEIDWMRQSCSRCLPLPGTSWSVCCNGTPSCGHQQQRRWEHPWLAQEGAANEMPLQVTAMLQWQLAWAPHHEHHLHQVTRSCL